MKAQVDPVLELIGKSYDHDMITLHNDHYSRIGNYGFSDDPFRIPLFIGFRSRGTKEFPLQIRAGDRITGFFGGINLNGSYPLAAAVEMYTGEIVNASSSPAYIIFGTTDNNSISRMERMRISESGNVGIGTKDPQSKLEIVDGDVFVNDISKGVIMKSPDGNCWRATIGNNGQIETALITCPN